jgi:hypothetical protein
LTDSIISDINERPINLKKKITFKDSASALDQQQENLEETQNVRIQQM